uniref:Uncharacterized protein n=1 Tax=Arion vulgaris TaxID=1028688 RepID=A0A0B6YYS3_9EUPU
MNIVTYTDGYADGGGEVWKQWQLHKITKRVGYYVKSFPTGKIPSNFRAEAVVLLPAQ